MTDFATKNERRRRAQVMNATNARRARAARKRYGPGGAFGWLREKYPSIHALCATGVRQRDEEAG